MTKRYSLLILAVVLGAILSTGILKADVMTPFEVSLSNLSNARIGDQVDVSVTMSGGSEKFGSLHLLLQYDGTRLTLNSAQLGNALAGCGWEYFNYVIQPCAICNTRLVDITGIADVASPSTHPSCYSPWGELVRLNFHITTDTTKAGSRAPIDFYWADCASNTLTSIASDTTWFGRFIYDYQGNEITGADPNLGGTLAGCIAPGPVVNIRGTNFHDGGISIKSDYGVYADCNGDGRFNVADIVYLITYIFGSGQTPRDYLHGDFDADGIVTVADAVYLLNYLFKLL